MIARALLALSLVLVAHRVHAQGVDPDTKSETAATALAVGGSLVGPTLILAALDSDRSAAPLHDEVVPMLVAGSAAIVLGPSLGNWYAHEGFSFGLGLRIGGGLGMLLGGSLFVPHLFSADNTRGDEVAMVAGVGLFGLGALAVKVGTIADIIEAPRAARAYNRNHVQLSLAPIAARSPSGHTAGVAIVGRF